MSSIHQEIQLPVSPDRVYAALTQAAQFQAFTGGLPVELDPSSGGAFKLFGGQIVGRNVECVANQRLVQAWRPTMWPEGVYSLVRIELRAQGKGTELVLDHSSFPEEMKEHLSAGWTRMYWEPLKKHFAGS
ncbi:MAG TPA: SRPBCC domain-containing protein [Polyangiaceae bacterium]|jgi:activator of HSP90 ATPase